MTADERKARLEEYITLLRAEEAGETIECWGWAENGHRDTVNDFSCTSFSTFVLNLDTGLHYGIKPKPLVRWVWSPTIAICGEKTEADARGEHSPQHPADWKLYRCEEVQ